MTISSTVRKAGPYVGNSVATSFVFSFKVFTAADVVATLATTATGAETVLTLSTHYTVALNADQNTNPGGTITYNYLGVPMPATQTLTLTSGVLQNQGTDIPNAGGWYPVVVEDALDKNVILVQQQTEEINRSLKIPVSDAYSNAALPAVAVRKNKVLGFDSSGAPMVYDPTTGGITDASQISFLHSGTAAIARTVENRFNDSFSVFDFLSAAQITDVKARTLSLDCTVAFQAAIAAALAVNGSLFVPAGSYKISDELNAEITTNYAGFRIYGDSGQGSVLDWRGGNTKSFLRIYGSASVGSTARADVYNLCLNNGNAATGLDGIVIGKTGGAPATEFGVGNTRIEGNVLKGMNIGVYTIYESDECTIKDNWIVFHKYAGVYNDGSSGVRIEDNHIQSFDQGTFGIFSRGTAISIKGNVIQSAYYPSHAIIVDQCTGFSILDNYTESPVGATSAICAQASQCGVIGGNNIGGYPNCAPILIKATSSEIQLLSNFMGQSGGSITNTVNIETGAVGISVLGKQATNGTVSTISGAHVAHARSTCWQFPLGINSIGGEYDNNEPVNYVTVNAGVTGDLFSIAEGGTYLVYISSSNAPGHGASGIVQAAPGSGVATLFKLAEDTATFTLAVTGASLVVRCANTTAQNRTVEWTALRIK